MLSAINGTFDPLGITTPVVILGKILYSEACLSKVSWDGKLPNEIVDRWNYWIKMLKTCSLLTIPRSVTLGKAERVIIHGFSDASRKAVVVAVYLVSYYKEMESESRLLVAKSRIAPRDTSVPRQELIGAHMLSRLLNHIKNTLTDNKICEYHG